MKSAGLQLKWTSSTIVQVGGGVVLDRIGSSVPNALLLCAAAVGAGGLFCALSFAVAGSLATFGPLFALGELGLFAIQACTWTEIILPTLASGFVRKKQAAVCDSRQRCHETTRSA
jgi:hypothetical protein